MLMEVAVDRNSVLLIGTATVDCARFGSDCQHVTVGVAATCSWSPSKQPRKGAEYPSVRQDTRRGGASLLAGAVSIGIKKGHGIACVSSKAASPRRWSWPESDRRHRC